jgi:hypothetical protein
MLHLTQKDDYEFLCRLYFSDSKDYLLSCIKRAYRDFNRTMQGFGSHPDRVSIHKKAVETLVHEINELKTQKDHSQEIFDFWHKKTCIELAKCYTPHMSFRFRIGQAQKWINMSLKYILILRDRVLGFEKWFPYIHVPIDSIIIERLEEGDYGVKPEQFFKCAWSRIDDYDGEYMNVQRWVRDYFPNEWPILVEFFLWMGKDADRKKS